MEIRELAEQALAEACASHLPPLEQSDTESEALRTAAIIGFTGDQLRGTIALAVGTNGLTAVREKFGVANAQAEDSLGETANLIAGHLKRSLSRYSQVITITPPIVVRGVTIEVCNTGESCRVEHDAHSADQHLVAWLDYEADEAIELVEAEDDDTVAQGETLFF